MLFSFFFLPFELVVEWVVDSDRFFSDVLNMKGRKKRTETTREMHHIYSKNIKGEDVAGDFFLFFLFFSFFFFRLSGQYCDIGNWQCTRARVFSYGPSSK